MTEAEGAVSPDVYLARLLASRGYDSRTIAPAPSCTGSSGAAAAQLNRNLPPNASSVAAGPPRPEDSPYGRTPTPAMIADYDLELVRAVRARDLAALARMHARGRTMDACNKFGESILHCACRRSHLPTIAFLLAAGARLTVSDDFGRTPLHDTCWTADKPCFEVVRMLLDRDLGLLRVSDRRGSTPLAYVRRDHWGWWCAFFEHQKETYWVPQPPSGGGGAIASDAAPSGAVVSDAAPSSARPAPASPASDDAGTATAAAGEKRPLSSMMAPPPQRPPKHARVAAAAAPSTAEV